MSFISTIKNSRGSLDLLNPALWERNDRGSELQFFATNPEVYKWFSSLPEELGPYNLWGTQLVKEGRRFRPQGFFFSLDEWLLHLKPDGSDKEFPNDFFLQAGAINPEMPAAEEVAELANFWGAVNGLTLVQHGATYRGKRSCSRIAVVNRVRNRRTGDVISLRERTAAFRYLKKTIEPALCFSSMHVFKDGHEEEDTVQLMTDGAAKLARSGYFERNVGRDLRR